MSEPVQGQMTGRLWQRRARQPGGDLGLVPPGRAPRGHLPRVAAVPTGVQQRQLPLPSREQVRNAASPAPAPDRISARISTRAPGARAHTAVAGETHVSQRRRPWWSSVGAPGSPELYLMVNWDPGEGPGGSRGRRSQGSQGQPLSDTGPMTPTSSGGTQGSVRRRGTPFPMESSSEGGFPA